MSLEQICMAPKIARFLADNQMLRDQPFILLDVGAREGFEKHWEAFGNQIRKYGVEPEAGECQRLNSIKGANEQYLPIALWKTEDEVDFNIAATAPSSSIYPPNKDLLKRFPDLENVKVAGAARLRTTTIDSLAKQKIPAIDFLKLDAEGAELEILKGAERSLKNSILGFSIEVLFQPWRQGAATFDRVHQFCISRGFRLFDLTTHRHVRSNCSFRTYPNCSNGISPFGQIIWGDALYLRDAAAELSNRQSAKWWTATRILKMLALFELHYLHDCANELLEISVQKDILWLYTAQTLAGLLKINRNELACFMGLSQLLERKRFGGVIDMLDGQLMAGHIG